MKLSLTQHGKTVTIEIDNDSLDIGQMMNECRCLLMAQDYPPESVDACFDGSQIDLLFPNSEQNDTTL